MKVSISGLIAGLVCLGVGGFLLASTWWAYSDYSRLQKYGGHTSAYITKKHFLKASDGATRYLLDYTFADPGGRKINSSAIVSKDQWDAFRVNDVLKIRYDQSDPRRHIPIYQPGTSPVFAFFMLMMGLVFLAFGGSRVFHSIQK